VPGSPHNTAIKDTRQKVSLLGLTVSTSKFSYFQCNLVVKGVGVFELDKDLNQITVHLSNFYNSAVCLHASLIFEGCF